MQWRHLLIILTAANAMFMFLTRNCLYIAIMSMADIKDQSQNDNHNSDCALVNQSRNSEIIKSNASFSWSLLEVDMILGAYFYAYTIFQIPSGFLLVLSSPRLVMNICKVIHALLTCIIPFASSYGAKYVFISRFLMGVAGAFVLPANAALLRSLALLPEVTVSMNLIIVFYGFGSLFAPIISGYLCSKPELGGWKTSFYVCGSIELTYALFFIVLSYSKFFNTNVQKIISNGSSETSIKESFKLLGDWKVYAYSYSIFAILNTANIIILKIPQYYSSILNYEIFENGLINSLPMIVFIAAPLFSSLTITAIANTKIVSPRLLYSIVYTVSMLIVLLLETIFTNLIGCNGFIAIGIFCCTFFCALSANTVVLPIVANHSNFVALSTGISNSIGNSSGFLVPFYANFFLKGDIYDRGNWQKLFFANGFIGFSGVIALNLMLWLGKAKPYLLLQNAES